MTNTQLRELLQHLDTNKDGVVDAGEFLDAMRRHEDSMTSTTPRSEKSPYDTRVPEQNILYTTPYSGGGGSVHGSVRGGGGLSPIRSLHSSRGSSFGESSSQRRHHLREELTGGGGGAILSPGRMRRASASPFTATTELEHSNEKAAKPGWKR